MPEDFTSAIWGVGYDSLDDNSNNNGDVPHGVSCRTSTRDVDPNLDRELDEVQRVMANPSPDVSATELHQALGHVQTPESKATANSAELYFMLPSELQAQAMKYEHFEQLMSGEHQIQPTIANYSFLQFTSMVNSEHRNILKPVKDSTVQLFAHLSPGLDLVALADWRKRTANPAFLSLLKQTPLNTEEVYTPLAPILFQDLSAMDVSGLFKNKVLTQIACVLHFRKGVLTGKKKGGPPRRGQKLKTTMTTEGVIAICCTLGSQIPSCTLTVHSLDDEFSSTGSQTGISYEKDFEFHIELLRKQENKRWALGIYEHFDSAMFGAGWHDGSQQPPSEAKGSAEPPRSWEDDMLSQLGSLGGTEGVNSDAFADPFTVQPTAHPPVVISSTQSAASQTHTNSLSVTGTAWGGTLISSTSVIVFTTGSELHLPLSDLSLGSSQPSISTCSNPPIPPVVVPALNNQLKVARNCTYAMLKDYETVAMIRCFMQALLMGEVGNLCFALHSFEGVLAEKPATIVALLGKAHIMHARQNYPQALKLLQLEVLQFNPSCIPDPRIGIGLCLWAMDHKAKAKAAWQHSLEVRGRTLMGTKYIKAAFKTNQKSAVAANALCKLFLQKSNLKQVLHVEGSLMDATKYYASATEGQPKHVLGAIGMAWMMYNACHRMAEPPNPQRSVEATVMLASLCAHTGQGYRVVMLHKKRSMLANFLTMPPKCLTPRYMSQWKSAVTADDLEMHLEVAHLWQEEQPE
ncbi:hypothetical protein F5141DRAFT_1066113 [Pisolithus sp. B1]|nr:hypothetical protein F5141DRAFT_1066113 [Pisolithus sp. B1]